MAKRKYVKENNLVKAINTDSLELQKPLVNEYYDINVHNSNMDKIDKGYKQNKNDISDIKNELSKTENTSYTTENGVKEFECKDGYVDNVVIEGETLVNLVTSNWTIVGSGSSLSGGKITLVQNGAIEECKQVVDMISSSKQYTLIYEVESSNIAENSFVVKGGENIYPFGANETLSAKIGINTVLLTPNKEDKTICFAISSSSSEGASIVFKNVMLLEGDHTDKPISYFEGLKSVGQGDKIEVLTYIDNKSSKIDLSSVTWVDNKHLKYTNLEENISGYSYTSTYIPISFKLGESLIIENGNPNICFYDENQNYIPHKLPWYSSDVRISIAPIPINAKYFRITVPINNKNLVNVYLVKQDKKQILTTLRSLPNGVKDTIEKRGNKYYKIKRCGEVTLNGSESWVLNANHIEVNTTRFSLLTTLNIKMIVGGILSSDKFTCVSDGITNDKEGIHTKANDGGLGIRIAKTKLSTQDVEGFKTWLSQNPVTVVYELATPIIEELPNFNPQTYSDNTTLLLNSGAVQGEVSFEVTNSLGSELEVLKGKVSDLDDYIDADEVYSPTTLNGWTYKYSNIPAITLIKKGNSVNVIGRITGGTLTRGTIVCKIPDNIKPKFNTIFPVFLNSSNAFGYFEVEPAGNLVVKTCETNTEVIINTAYSLI